MKRVLFICLGNICRSPSAEAVFQFLVNQSDDTKSISCDSAGIIGYHEGDPSDSRMKGVALKRGYELTSISRPFNPNFDFDRFDYIVGMDDDNITALENMARTESDKKKIVLMTDFCKKRFEKYVPDPYYGGPSGFELVLDILEDACLGLLETIKEKEAL